MQKLTAKCPVTGRDVFPGSQVSFNWDGKSVLTITCPACNRPHVWNPITGTLRDVELDDDA